MALNELASDAHHLESSARVNEVSAGVVGAVFVVVGLAGFVVGGDHSLTGQLGGQPIGVFHVNTLHNLVHVIVGAVLIAAAIVSGPATRLANRVVGVALLILGVTGLFLAGFEPWSLINLNAPDSVLHLAIAAGLLYVARPIPTPPPALLAHLAPQDPDDHEVRGAKHRRS